MSVDLPVPFSPAKKVTSAVNSMSRLRMAGIMKGYSPLSATPSFNWSRTRYGGVAFIRRSFRHPALSAKKYSVVFSGHIQLVDSKCRPVKTNDQLGHGGRNNDLVGLNGTELPVLRVL